MTRVALLHRLRAELADGGLDLVDFGVGAEECGWAVGRVRSSQKEDNHG